MEGCDEESMNTLMDLQYNANKLHIEFHQKAVALRTKYEANLERIIKEMKNRNKKAKLNQSCNNKNFKNAQTETNFDSQTKEAEEEEDDEEKTEVVLTLSSDRKSSQPRNYKSASSSRRSTSVSDKNNSSQVSRQKNVFFQENSQNDDFYDEYNESSHLEDSFKESIKATTTTTDEDVSKQRSSQRKSSSHLSRASNNNNSEVAEIRSVSPKINPITKPEVPCFWLRVFLNCKYTKDRVQVADQAPLYNMTNLKVNSDLSHLESDNAYRFILEFYFRKNDYFTNSILTKEYFVQLGNNLNKNNNSRTVPNEPNDTYVNCKGCRINWKPGMNVTKPELKSEKIDKNAEKRSKKSFFNFFNPPEYWQDEAMAVKHQKDIEEDYRFGLVLKEKVIPRAISYYLVEQIPKSSGSESVSIVTSSTLPRAHFRSA